MKSIIYDILVILILQTGKIVLQKRGERLLLILWQIIS